MMISIAMKTLIEAALHGAETGGFLHDDAGVAGNALRFSLNQSSPVPLWIMARTQTIGFQRGDLERTHWKKVWRSMFVD